MNDKLLALSEDGTIVYQKLTFKYLEEVCLVAQKTLFAGVNVSRAFGVSEDPEALAELDQLSSVAAKDGISIIAVDKNTDKVVGIAINKLLTKNQSFYENFLKTFKNPKSRNVVKYIIATDNIIDLFEYYHVNCLMELSFLGTLSEYRKRGIAKKLVELSVDTAQNLYNGINVKLSLDGEVPDLEPVPEGVSAIFTSFISQRIGETLGFEVVAERSNKKIEIDGKVFENSGSETATAQVQVKILHKR